VSLPKAAIKLTKIEKRKRKREKRRRRMMMRNVKRKQLQQIHNPCNFYAPPAWAAVIAIRTKEKNIFRAKCFKNSVRLGKEKKIEAAACSNIGQQISSFLMHQ
jgi:hypothetical protein